MANQEVFTALEALGFQTISGVCCGTWKGYAVSLRPIAGRSFYVDVAVRLASVPASLKKSIRNAVKAQGLKIGGAEMIKKRVITASMNIPGSDDPAVFFSAWMDKLAGVLREQGIAPADTCAVSGASRPDSLCLTVTDGILCYQPVSASVIRQRAEQVRETVEDNADNGSYLLGFIGALLGMLVGVLVNVLGIVFTERIYALAFALVPVASMFGYKLFRGKMSKGSVFIVIALCIVGILLIPVFEIAILLVREYRVPFMTALRAAVPLMTDPDLRSEVVSELLQLTLFMGLGLLIARRYMSSATNSSKAATVQQQLDSLRPNPAYAASGETEQAF